MSVMVSAFGGLEVGFKFQLAKHASDLWKIPALKAQVSRRVWRHAFDSLKTNSLHFKTILKQNN